LRREHPIERVAVLDVERAGALGVPQRHRELVEALSDDVGDDVPLGNLSASNDNYTGGVPQATPALDHADGSLSILGADVRFGMKRFGFLVLGVSQTSAEHVRTIGGVVQVLTRPPSAGRTDFATAAGDFALRSAELALAVPAGTGTIELRGRAFATDGFVLVAPEDRGPVDLAAWSRHRWVAARWRQPVGRNAELSLHARTFEEKRGNGTPDQRNSTREDFAILEFS